MMRMTILGAASQFMKYPGYRISGELANANKVMNDTAWIGVCPGLTEEMLAFVAKKIEQFFGVNF